MKSNVCWCFIALLFLPFTSLPFHIFFSICFCWVVYSGCSFLLADLSITLLFPALNFVYFYSYFIHFILWVYNNNKMKIKWQNSDPTQLERVNMKWDSLQTIKTATAAAMKNNYAICMLSSVLNSRMKYLSPHEFQNQLQTNLCYNLFSLFILIEWDIYPEISLCISRKIAWLT